MYFGVSEKAIRDEIIQYNIIMLASLPKVPKT